MAKIGKDLLQMIMMNLYPEPEIIYREYIQNSFDSIKQAVRENLIDKNDGHIVVTIDPAIQEITILDNGVGIPASKAESTLKNIAISPKRMQTQTNAGFYGIGRLVGAGYCKKLTFKTSAKGENISSILSFDVEQIRNIIADKTNNSEAAEIIEQTTVFSSSETEELDKHYFKVTMEGVNKQFPNLLDEQKVIDYLVQVAPIDYKLEFRNTKFNPSLKNCDKEIVNQVRQLEYVQLSVNNQVDLQKRYSYEIEGTNDFIDSLRFFILKRDNDEPLAWGWYAITEFSTQIPDFIDAAKKIPVLTRGMRLRCHNIQIGTGNFFDGSKFFTQARSNKYFNGEVHIIHKNIKPTPDRSSLAPSVETNEFIEKLKHFFNTEMQQVYQAANKAKSSILNIEKAKQRQDKLEQQKKDEELSSEDIKIEENKVTELNNKAEIDLQKSLLNKKPNNEGMEAMLKVYEKKYTSMMKGTNNKPTKPSSPSQITPPSSEDDIEPIDKIKELQGLYSQEELTFLRRIFSIIDLRFAKDSYAKTKRAMELLIINELKKDKNK